jgi:hypothetical protein
MLTARELIEKYGIQDGKLFGHPGKLWIAGSIAAKLSEAEKEELKARKAEIMAELRRMEEEEKERQRREREEKIAKIKSGTEPIQLRYHDGEYLQGWEALGLAGELLESLGLARYVTNWGYLVPQEIVDALGTRFTYGQAEQYAAGRKTTRQNKDDQMEKALERARQKGDRKRFGRGPSLAMTPGKNATWTW